jgi:CelD/BcsL family acetyltransferase involved in cellulose biosynthesis
MSSNLSPRVQHNEPMDHPVGPETATVQWHRGGVELLDRLADEWRGLCSQGSCNQPFFQPEWIRAYLSAFDPNASVLLITVHTGGRLAGVLPLVEQRRVICGLPVKVLASPTNVHSCRFDLITSRGSDGQAALQAIWESIKQLREWTLIALDHVPVDGAAPQLLDLARRQGYGGALVESFASPYFSLAEFAGDWDSWLSRLKGDFRRELRRRRRKLEAGGEVRLLRMDQATPTVLQHFYDLEASGWKGEGGTAIECAPPIRRFYDEVAMAASRFGYLAMYFLELSGRPIAGHFGLNFGGRYFVPKLAFDEKYAAFSPGHLLVHDVARDCAERGVAEFDFLGEEMEWKAAWAQAARRLCSVYVFNDDRLGRILHAAKFGIKSAVKNMLRSVR